MQFAVQGADAFGTTGPYDPDVDWDAVIAVNLKGAFNVTRAVARTMLRQRAGRRQPQPAGGGQFPLAWRVRPVQ